MRTLLRCIVWLGIGGVAAGLITFAAPSANAASSGGAATIVSPANGLANSQAPLATGGNDTSFSLRLPADAACTGDSATGQYRVQSFMVKANVDLAAMTFGEVGPIPTGIGANFSQPLFLESTDAFVNAGTNVADKPGSSGQVINIPDFTLSGFSVADLPPGKYVVGVACTKGPASAKQLDRYWSAELNLAAGTSGESSRVWTAPAVATTSGGGSDGASTPVSTPERAATVPVPKVEAAVPARVADAESAKATGGDPSFGLPVVELPSVVGLPHGSTPSVIRWLALGLVLGRIGLLISRRPRSGSSQFNPRRIHVVGTP